MLQKYNGKVLIIIGVLVISIGLTVWFIKSGQRSTNEAIPELQTQEVATDPSFTEVKGQLIPGFPELPVYPGASIVASAKTNPEIKLDIGYRAKWKASDPVLKVMKWYLEELPKYGWNVEPPNDPNATGEQVASIAKEDLKGYLEVASESEAETEIWVEVRKNQ